MSENVNEHEREFRPGDVVVVTQDFHSSYFRGLIGVVDGTARRGPTGQTLYRLKIDVPPGHTTIPAKYLQLKLEADEAVGAAAAPAGERGGAVNGATADRPRGSFFSRLFSRGK